MEYFDEQQVDSLVDKLGRLTHRDLLEWHKIQDDYQFATELNGTVFRIVSNGENDLGPHALTIFASEDDGLRELQEVNAASASRDLATKLDRLYALVKRRTLNIDTVAKSILDELEQLEGTAGP